MIDVTRRPNEQDVGNGQRCYFQCHADIDCPAADFFIAGDFGPVACKQVGADLATGDRAGDEIATDQVVVFATQCGALAPEKYGAPRDCGRILGLLDIDVQFVNISPRRLERALACLADSLVWLECLGVGSPGLR